MDFIIGILVTVLGGIALWKIKNWIESKKELEIKHEKAPRNILEHIKPGISIDRVKEILGVPYRERRNNLSYKFSNVLIEVQSDENSVQTITLLLNKVSKKNTFKIPRIDKTLGDVKLNDIIGECEEPHHDFSAKHVQIWTECYFGYPGLYNYYTFGIFAGPVGAFNGQIPNMEKLKKGDAPDIKANYVSISNKSGEGGHFDFWAMV